MQIIAVNPDTDKPRIVQLNNDEQRASAMMDNLMDKGKNITDAIDTVRFVFPDLSDEFYNWLSQ